MKLRNYDCFCVYEHVHPRTKNVRYVGMGLASRAYNTHRSSAHERWLYQLLQSGYSIWDIVQIKHKDLPRDIAIEIEESLIKFHKDRGCRLFNLAHFAPQKIDRSRMGRPKKQNKQNARLPEELGKPRKRCWN